MTDSEGRPDQPEHGDTQQPWSRVHVWHIQAVRDLLVLVAVIGVFWAGYAIRAVTVPLLVALMLAYLFEPVICWMVQHKSLKFSRPKAVGTLLATVGVVVIIVLALALPLIVGQTTQLISSIRDGTMQTRISRLDRYVPENMRDQFQSFVDWLPGTPPPTQIETQDPVIPPESLDEDSAEQPEKIAEDEEPPVHWLTEEEVQRIVDERIAENAMQQAVDDEAGTRDNLWSVIRKSAEPILHLFSVILQIGLLTFLIPFYFFFFSVWYPDVVKFGRGLIPSKNKDHILDLLGKMDQVVAGFVRGRIVISLIMGIMLAIGWWICGVPYAIVLGLVIGIFCAVPYLGGVGVPLAVALLLFSQLENPADERMAWWGIILWPTLVFGIVQTIEGYVLTPMIAGKVTNLDPVTILVVVLAGGSVMGVYGMLLAIPIAACGKILITDVLLPNIRKWAQGRSQDPLPLDPE